jgi:hypothetical protein
MEIDPGGARVRYSQSLRLPKTDLGFGTALSRGEETANARDRRG